MSQCDMAVHTHPISLCVALAILMASTPATLTALSGVGTARLDILVAQTGNKLAAAEVKLINGHAKTRFIVRGGTGIGRVTVQRLDDHWPDRVFLRLHLRGMESLQVSNEHVTLRWSIPSVTAGRRRALMSSTEDGARRRISSSDPHYVPVRLVAETTQIPLHDGYFEVLLPATLFKGDPDAVSIHWIDFYR